MFGRCETTLREMNGGKLDEIRGLSDVIRWKMVKGVLYGYFCSGMTAAVGEKGRTTQKGRGVVWGRGRRA